MVGLGFNFVGLVDWIGYISERVYFSGKVCVVIQGLGVTILNFLGTEVVIPPKYSKGPILTYTNNPRALDECFPNCTSRDQNCQMLKLEGLNL